MNSLLKLLPAKIGKLLSVLRKAGKLVKGQEGIQAMRYSPEISGQLTQLKGHRAIISTGLFTSDFLRVHCSAVRSPQVIPTWCLSTKWKSATTNTDQGQKLKLRNLKENLTSIICRPIAVVIGEGEESQDQGRDPILKNRQVRKQAALLWGLFDL